MHQLNYKGSEASHHVVLKRTLGKISQQYPPSHLTLYQPYNFGGQSLACNLASVNEMMLNPAKCNFMRISRKNITLAALPLVLNGSVLEEVNTFKYLGVLISSDLSWSTHIQSLCSKARKIAGLLYRRYYQLFNSYTLVQISTSLVRCHVEYAAAVWDPHQLQGITMIENVQKFAPKVCSKQWDTGYFELLNCPWFMLLPSKCYHPKN